MKKLGLLLSAALATVLFVGNAAAVSVTVGTIEVKNKTKGDIWVTFNAVSKDCPNGCSYTRIADGDKKSPLQSLTGSLLNVYAYEDGKHYKPYKGFRVKGDSVEVTIEKGAIKITEPNK